MFTTKYNKKQPAKGKKKKVLKYSMGGLVAGIASGLAASTAANRARGGDGTSAKDKAALKDYDTAQDTAQDEED